MWKSLDGCEQNSSAACNSQSVHNNKHNDGVLFETRKNTRAQNVHFFLQGHMTSATSGGKFVFFHDMNVSAGTPHILSSQANFELQLLFFLYPSKHVSPKAC